MPHDAVHLCHSMKMIAQQPGQTTQRIKVGMIGLAAVLLLIGFAAAIFSTASRERAVAGGARADVVANMMTGNGISPADSAVNEPLAELGVAPSADGPNVNRSSARR